MAYIIGLTGGIASGKTTVAQKFAKLGVSIIDADLIAREVVAPGSVALTQIAEHFGDAVLLTDGSLNRAALRKHIFASPEQRHWLNHHLHPLIQKVTQKRFSEVSDPWCLWVVPLLVENKLSHQANRVLVVDVDTATQRQRLMRRDNCSLEMANNILASQASRAARLALADDIIDNELTAEALDKQIDTLYHRYQQLALINARMGNL